MSQCPNCKRNLGCSCQIRTATNQAKCCSACIAELEKKIILEKIEKAKNG